MKEWMNGRMNEWMNERMHACINKRMNGWMNACMYEWMDGWTSEWMSEWMNAHARAQTLGYLQLPSAYPPPCATQDINHKCVKSNVPCAVLRKQNRWHRIDYRMKWKRGRHTHQISKTLLGLPIPPWASIPSWTVLCTQNQPKYNEKQDAMLANFQKELR